MIDTSAWVEYLRGAQSPAARAVRTVIRSQPDEILTCAPIRMELAFDPDDAARARVLDILDGLASVTIDEGQFETAAVIYRTVRRCGHTVRSSIDCLIAACALSAAAELLHSDVDFDRIAAAIPRLRVWTA